MGSQPRQQSQGPSCWACLPCFSSPPPQRQLRSLDLCSSPSTASTAGSASLLKDSSRTQSGLWRVLGQVLGWTSCKRRAKSAAVPVERSIAPTSEQLLCLSIVKDVQAAGVDWVSEADARRLLLATEGDADLARRKLVAAAKWRQETLLSWHAEVDARASTLPNECRQIAISAAGNPLMYNAGVHQQRCENVAANWAVAMDTSIAAAGPDTYLDFVIDSTGFQLMLNLRIGPWISFGPSIDSYFAERFNSIWVIDMPAAGRFIWNAMYPLIPKKTKGKIHFVSRSKPDEVRSMLDALCDGDDMRQMVSQLLDMNQNSTPQTGRSRSHALTSNFLQAQRQKRQTKDEA